MQLTKLKAQADTIAWPTTSNELPVISWDQFQIACETRDLIVIAGFIHDVTEFMDQHPGGRALVKTRLGKDATSAFFGGVYDHSNGANNVLAMLRVGCIEGGYEIETLKKYSEVIENLRVSGNAGTAGKAGDLGKGLAQRTVGIKENPAYHGLPISTLEHKIDFNVPRNTGGLQL